MAVKVEGLRRDLLELSNIYIYILYFRIFLRRVNNWTMGIGVRLTGRWDITQLDYT